MGTRQIQWSYCTSSLVLVLILVGALGGQALACDHDPPIHSEGIDFFLLSFGGPSVQTREIARSIDAKEAVEPRLTALLTMGELTDSSSGTVVATTRSVVDTWMSNLGSFVKLTSEVAMRDSTPNF